MKLGVTIVPVVTPIPWVWGVHARFHTLTWKQWVCISWVIRSNYLRTNFNMRAKNWSIASVQLTSWISCMKEIRQVFSELIKRTRGATFLFLYRAAKPFQLALGPLVEANLKARSLPCLVNRPFWWFASPKYSSDGLRGGSHLSPFFILDSSIKLLLNRSVKCYHSVIDLRWSGARKTSKTRCA